MRHQVGDKVWVFGVKAHFTDGGKRRYNLHYMAPHPRWVQIERLVFQELTIEEHHKVAWEWGGEAKYDGFIARDADGRVWHNQYPQASYGQMDDTADGDFTLATLETDFVTMYQDTVDGLDRMEDDLLAKGCSLSMFNLCRFLNHAAGGICLEDGTPVYRDANHQAVAEEWKPIVDRVLAEFHQQTGRTLTSYLRNYSVSEKPTYMRKWRVE